MAFTWTYLHDNESKHQKPTLELLFAYLGLGAPAPRLYLTQLAFRGVCRRIFYRYMMCIFSHFGFGYLIGCLVSHYIGLKFGWGFFDN
jgi:hypothetical protein